MGAWMSSQSDECGAINLWSIVSFGGRKSTGKRDDGEAARMLHPILGLLALVLSGLQVFFGMPFLPL